MKLTIGLPSYNNFTEVFFTVQALRMYQNLRDCEILVVDNFGDPQLEEFVHTKGAGIVRYEKYVEKVGTSCTKNMIFELAKGEMVLCMDSHVLIKTGALENIPITEDLVHGPLVYADLKNYCCAWKNEWRGNMWGIWDSNVTVLPKEPFEIWGMGTGFFLTKRTSWLGYNKNFKGFGGEQGYLHEKYRKAGRKVWCYPNLVWMHMFDRKIPYPNNMNDRIRNYIIGHQELGLDLAPIVEHFGKDVVDKIVNTEAQLPKTEISVNTELEEINKIKAAYGIILTAEEILEIKKTIKEPCNFLIFGLGKDSIFWHNANKSGNTIFIEDTDSWINLIKVKYPEIKAHKVVYGTKREEWRTLLKRPELLELDLPEEIKSVKWDIVLVDGPQGFSNNTPGRMKSIYMASKLTKNEGLVFVHDMDREVEQEYCKEYLLEKNRILSGKLSCFKM